MAIQKISNAVIDTGAVTSDSLATGAVNAADISAGTITVDKLHTTLNLSSHTVTLPSGTTLGTTTAGLFDIQGGSTTSAQIRFFDGGTAQARIGVPAGETYLSLSGSNTLTPDVVVTSGGNVGIGTTSPSYPLEVEGTATTNTDIVGFSNSNGTAKHIFGLENVGAGTYKLLDQSNNTAVFFSGHSADNSYINAGNVGIGTTNPTYLLKVGPVNTTETIAVQSAGGGSETIMQSVSGTDSRIGSSANTPLNLITNNVSRMTINTSGNVGIGATSIPSANSAYLTVGTQDYAISHNGFSKNSYFDGSNYTAVTNNAGKLIQMGDDIIFYHSPTVAAGAAQTQTALMVLEGGGNVGIGTTSPSAKLTVAATGSPKIEVKDTDNSSTAFMQADGTNGGYFGTLTNHPVRIAPNNSTKMIVTTTGNVGIGDNNPYAKLQISTNVNAGEGSGSAASLWLRNDNTSNNASSNIFFGRSSGSAAGAINFVHVNGSHDGRIVFDVREGSNYNSGAIVIQPDGHVTSRRDAGLGSSIQYGTAEKQEIYRQLAPNANNAGSLNTRHGNTEFYPPVSGEYEFQVYMYITTGTYYFSFGIWDETTNTRHWHSRFDGGQSYNQYEYPSGQSGNVHNYKQYVFTVPDMKAGHRYKLFMNGSDATGSSEVTNASQTNYIKQFRVYSLGPKTTRTLTDRIYFPKWHPPTPANDSSNASSINYIQNTYNIPASPYAYTHTLGIFTWRAYARYLDIRTNVNSNSAMLFATMSGYFYGHGVSWAIRGGYMYTNNSVISQSEAHIGNPYIYNFYRDGSGFFCIKLYKPSTGYTEGQALVNLGGHSPGEWNGVHATDAVMSNTSSNMF